MTKAVLLQREAKAARLAALGVAGPAALLASADGEVQAPRQALLEPIFDTIGCQGNVVSHLALDMNAT
jgi:hypothetical protein